MQRFVLITCISLIVCVAPIKMYAQIPVAEAIKQGVTKVIKAVDLQVQRLQNKTIWLQNAQKVIENSMSELHLSEITEWAQKQTDLYNEYYSSLSKVKSIITYYHQIKDISNKQAQLIAEYKHAWSNIRQDNHFSVAEVNYMSQVYTGILDESIKNIDQLLLVVNSFVTQMADAKRMEIINSVADKVDKNYNDLHQFNNQNAILSLQRAKDMNDAAVVKWMYGL